MTIEMFDYLDHILDLQNAGNYLILHIYQSAEYFISYQSVERYNGCDPFGNTKKHSAFTQSLIIVDIEGN